MAVYHIEKIQHQFYCQQCVLVLCLICWSWSRSCYSWSWL